LSLRPDFLSRMKAARIFIRKVRRRRYWLREWPARSALTNLVGNAWGYLWHSDNAAPLPSMVKIDISPLCGLACPHCLHAKPEGRNRPLLDAQTFGQKDKMTIDQFTGIVEQLRGKAIAVSLYYYGDPLIHPQLDDMIRVARAARLGVHITTHFSYKLKMERIRRLVDSGLSHITVALDGSTQENYRRTRVNGRLDLVTANLAMIAAYKRERGSDFPFIEVQHLRFPHHPEGEDDVVRKMALKLGADKFTTYAGVHRTPDGDFWNVVDDDVPAGATTIPAEPKLTPRCLWPHSSTVIRFDGAVIPCCLWRVGRQYGSARDGIVLGNVFQTPLSAIWNGEAYQQIRRQVSNPVRDAEGQAAPSFCDGCPKVSCGVHAIPADARNSVSKKLVLT
jgi:MoaA/NifB/PqqE/SkfB family radical SAM enzyme